MKKCLLFVCLLLGVSACEDANKTTEQIDGEKPQANVSVSGNKPVQRWYTQQQVQAGGPLYQKYCAECHQPDASGTANWRQLDEDGNYPPPPLNGTAHTWHHHLDGLRGTIRRGGVPLGGKMPGFADRLGAQDIDNILAWVQSHWSDEIYLSWKRIDEQAGQ